MLFVYITAGNVKDAKNISKHLLQKKLVACVNIFPIESMYWFNNELQENTEFSIIAKTRDENFEKIDSEIKKIHTYDVPCVVAWKIDKAHKPFEKWVSKETKI
ncbi:divalent-cation tolerance protein CutA [Candidatus Woesearchaeota archaeon]|nr:divalent-cation tolerance protein CutA [Candidatus Woesearchaeota archaeon]